MWTVFTGLSLLLVFINNYLHNFLAIICHDLHSTCLNLSPESTDFPELYKALICNENPTPTLFLSDMRVVGLYHLIVVSGSHLVFLEQLILLLTRKMNRKMTLLIFITLTLFTMICEFSAPVTRAWVSFMLRKINAEEELFWRGYHITFLSGLLSLALFPEWIISLSFLLSWGAALFISIEFIKGIKKQLLIYSGLLPLFYSLQISSPLTALVNWLLGPIVGLLILPACLFSFFYAKLIVISDFLIRSLNVVIHFIASELWVYPVNSGRISFIWGWLFIIFNQIFWMHQSVQFTRKKNSQYEK